MSSFISYSPNFNFVIQNQKTLIICNNDWTCANSFSYEIPISAICGHPQNDQVAVSLENKNLIIYNINEKGELSEFTQFKVPHTAIQILFDSYRNVPSLLVLNSGELCCYNIETKEMIILLGSICTATSFKISNDRNTIISADRDARIRISRYPATYDIKAFCLNHEEFISCIEYIDDQTIISCDGDGQLGLWSINGDLLQFSRIAPSGTIIRSLLYFVPQNNSEPFIALIMEKSNNLTLINPKTLTTISTIALPVTPLCLTTINDNIVVGGFGGIVLVKSDGTIESVNEKLFSQVEGNIDDYSYESFRVIAKQIVHKGDKGTEIYDSWRFPVKHTPDDMPSKDDID